MDEAETEGVSRCEQCEARPTAIEHALKRHPGIASSEQEAHGRFIDSAKRGGLPPPK
jgi:hypothetical protein